MKIRCGKPNTEGTTLVDVVMSVALIAVLAGGVIGSLTFGFQTMGRVRENQRATQVMLETVETIRLYTWDQVNSNGFVPLSFTNVYDPQAAPGRQGVVYYGSIETNRPSLGATIDMNMLQMKVNLRWTNQGIPHLRSVTTYIAKDGLQNYEL